MSVTLDSIILPDGLWWENETEWTPIDQVATFSTEGALLIDRSTRLSGRPIVLTGSESTAWLSRETVEALQVVFASGEDMTLVVRDRTFTVIWNYEEKPALDIEPVVRMLPIENSDFYWVRKLSFLAKEEL